MKYKKGMHPGMMTEKTLEKKKTKEIGRVISRKMQTMQMLYAGVRGEERRETGNAKGDGGSESFYDSSAAVSEVARRNKTDFHDGIMPERNMCIGSLRAR